MNTHVDDLPPETNVFLFAKTLTGEMNAPKDIQANIFDILTSLYQITNIFQNDHVEGNNEDSDIYKKIIETEIFIFNSTILPIKVAVAKEGPNRLYIEEEIHNVPTVKICNFLKHNLMLYYLLNYRNNYGIYGLTKGLDVLTSPTDDLFYRYIDLMDSILANNPENWYEFISDFETEIKSVNMVINKHNKTIVSCIFNLYSKEEFDSFDLKDFMRKILLRNIDNIEHLKLISLERGSIKISIEVDTNDLEGLLLSLKSSGLLSNKVTQFNITNNNKYNDANIAEFEHNHLKTKLKKAFLLKDGFDEGLEQLEEKIENGHPSQINTFLVLKANYINCKEKWISGTESHDVLSREQNRITMAILDFIDTLDFFPKQK